MNENEEKLIKALESNWQHARHVEVLRLQFAGIYIAAVFGGGLTAFSNVGSAASIIASLAMVATTLLALGMTHKLNMEFANQIQKADACARALKISTDQPLPRTMHEMMGFPIRGTRLKWLSVRRMFNSFYITFFIGWLCLSVYFWMKLSVHPVLPFYL